MKNLKLSNKIMLTNIILSVMIGIAYQLSQAHISGEETALAIGITALGMALINLFIGLLLLFTQEKEWRNGFLITGAVMLLFSGITCGTGAAL